MTLRDVLSHAAGLHHPGGVEVELVPPHQRDALRRSAASAGWKVGVDVAYSERFAWHLVGLVLERTSGEPLRDHLRRSVLDPLEMLDTWVGMTDDDYDAVVGRIGLNHDMRTLHSFPLLLERGRRMCTEVNAAHGGYSTASDLARLYAAMLRQLDGEEPTAALASPATLRTFVSPARPATLDRILDRECEHGLGFMTDLRGHAFGPLVSPSSFGHSGNVGSSFAWADPDRDLACAVVFNGIVDPESAFVRRPAVVRAIYRDLDALEAAAAEADEGEGDSPSGDRAGEPRRRRFPWRR